MMKLYAVLLFVILGFINADAFQQPENNKALPSGERTNVSEDVFIHSSINSDSMLIERGPVYSQVYQFISEGIKVHDRNTTAGICVGKIKQYAIGRDTLTTIKDDCGAGGFENHQFITRNNSLVMYRKYRMEVTVDGRTNLSEDVYEFKGTNLTQRKRYRTGKGPDDVKFVQFPFRVTQRPGEADYKKISGWLTGGYSVWRK